MGDGIPQWELNPSRSLVKESLITRLSLCSRSLRLDWMDKIVRREKIGGVLFMEGGSILM